MKGLGLAKEDWRFSAYWVPWYCPFSASSTGSSWRWAGKEGDMGVLLKPGVLGADWVRSWAR